MACSPAWKRLVAVLALPWLLAAGSMPALGSERPSTAERIIGILALGPLCWWPCEGHDRPVPLYAQPDDSTSPLLRLERGETLGLQITEYDYEEPGALVYDRRAGWYKVKAGNLYLWIAASAAGTFHPYPDILLHRLSYLTDRGLRLRSQPSESAGLIEVPAVSPSDRAEHRDIAIEVRAVFEDGQKNKWLDITVLDASPCIASQPLIVAQGWVPAYTPDGGVAAWFYPRGC